jgi:hypothetical protein
LATIADTVPMARSALGDSGPLTVHVYASADDYVSAIVAGANKTPDAVRAYLEGGSHISEASPGAIWVWVPNFRRQSADSQRISIFHEYFHTVALKFSNNRALGPPTGTRGSPRWLFEGSARYFEFVSGEMFGYKSLFGATDLASNIKVQIRQVKTRSYGPLASYEGGGAPPSGGGSPQHELGALATDYLVRTYGMDKVKRDYWVAMGNSDWRGAFATVFGVPSNSSTPTSRRIGRRSEPVGARLTHHARSQFPRAPGTATLGGTGRPPGALSACGAPSCSWIAPIRWSVRRPNPCVPPSPRGGTSRPAES